MTDDLGAIAELGGAAAVELAASALADRGAKPENCKNCGAPVLASYCSVCGQQRDLHRHTIPYLFHHLFAELGSFDGRVVRTLVALLFRPGELPLAFHQGRTRRYMPAVRLYLFSSLLLFLTLSVTHLALVQVELREVPNAYTVRAMPNGAISILSNGHAGSPIPATVAHGIADKSLSPGVHSGLTVGVHFFRPIGQFHQHITPEGWARIAELKESILRAVGNDKYSWTARNALSMIEKLARDPAALNDYLTAWIPRVFFLLLPLFALLLGLLYFRQRRNFFFVDHLVFSFSIHSFVFAVLILAVGASQVLPGGLVAKLFFLLIAVYLLVGLKRFYGQGWVASAAKFTALSFMYVVFCLGPALTLVTIWGFIEG